METKSITAVIVDDETKSRQTLVNLVQKYCKNIQIIGEADNIKNAVETINNLKPKLLFLDIQLKEGTSFEILKQLIYHNYFVVFTTAHNEYAIKAFKFSAIDYLLKPIDLEELIDAVNKVHQSITNNKISTSPLVNQLLSFNQYDPTITVTSDTTIEFIKIYNIIRLESKGSYTTFYLTNGKTVLASKNLKIFEDILISYNFFRAHQSHLINMKYVTRLIKTDGNSIEMFDNSQVPLARRKKEEFLKLKMEN